jgi:hypothetical protein
MEKKKRKKMSKTSCKNAQLKELKIAMTLIEALEARMSRHPGSQRS